MPLPHLGIAQPVRVCETCYEERNLQKAKLNVNLSSPTSPAASSAASRSAMQPRSARVEDDDDKDLKMALAMSLEEAKRMGISADTSAPSKAPAPVTQSKPVTRTVAAPKPEEEDEDLKAAIAASLKDMEAKKALQSSYVAPVSEPAATTTTINGSTNSTNGVTSASQYQYVPPIHYSLLSNLLHRANF